jgi:hypothetical protein
MKTDLIHISKKIHFENSFKSVISFKKFIDFLKSSIQSGPFIKVPYFKWIIKKFKKFPELSNNVPLEKLSEYEEMLELVSTCLLPLAADENMLWALSSPLSPQIFYSTDAFQNETLLLNDLEELDLETLQGVDGLKAIRVGVRIEDVSSVSLSMNKFEKSI